MTKGPIRLDRSSSGVVIVCDLCPWWSAFRFTVSGADDCSCNHEESSHPELRHRRDARDQRASKARKAEATRRANREKSGTGSKV